MTTTEEWTTDEMADKVWERVGKHYYDFTSALILSKNEFRPGYFQLYVQINKRKVEVIWKEGDGHQPSEGKCYKFRLKYYTKGGVTITRMFKTKLIKNDTHTWMSADERREYERSL